MMNRSLRHAIKLHNFASNVEGNTNIYNIVISNNIILNTVRGYGVGESGSIVLITAPPSGKVSTYSEIYNGYFNENSKNTAQQVGSVNSIGAHNITISDNQIGQTINSTNAKYWYDTYKDYLIDLQYEHVETRDKVVVTKVPMPYYNNNDTNITPGQIRFINPLIEASIFATPCIRIFNSANNLKIDNNTFFGGGFNMLPSGSAVFDGQTIEYNDPLNVILSVPAIHINNNEKHYFRLNNWKITNNNFQDWAAIGGPILEMGCQPGKNGSPNYGNVEISNNIFDADPYFRFPTRKLINGKQTGAFWQRGSDNGKFHISKTFGMWISNIQAQITVKNNTFKNIHTPMYPRALSEIYEAKTSGLLVDNNTIFCDPVIPPSIPPSEVPTCVDDDILSDSGIYIRGVGYIPYSLGTNWNKVIINGDPENANYGIVSSQTISTDAYFDGDISAPPTEKNKFHFYGDFVENRIKGFPVNGTFILGWQKYRTGTDSGYWHCITTGSGNSVSNNILTYTPEDVKNNVGKLIVAGSNGTLEFTGHKDTTITEIIGTVNSHTSNSNLHINQSGPLTSINSKTGTAMKANVLIESDNTGKLGYTSISNGLGTTVSNLSSKVTTLSSTVSSHINDMKMHIPLESPLYEINQDAATNYTDEAVLVRSDNTIKSSGWKIQWVSDGEGKLTQIK